MRIDDIFNEKRTQNGDKAFYSTNSQYLDTILRFDFYRKNPEKIPVFLNSESEFDKYFARMIRDPRRKTGGFGGRALGRELLRQVKAEPSEILVSGRADDIFELGWKEYSYNPLTKGGKYWSFLYKILSNADKINKSSDPEMQMVLFNATKWLPRVHGDTPENIKTKARAFRDSFGLTSNQYQKLVRNLKTVEAVLSRGDRIENYESVPSGARLRHKAEFEKDPNYAVYMDKVAKGEAKIATGTMDLYNIAKNYENKKITAMEADIFYKSFEKAKLSKMIAIVDNSDSMHWKSNNDAYLKARAIGMYIAKNSEYMNNKVISFSSYPKLISLGNDYASDTRALSSFGDASNTNFGRVMEQLSRATEDLPDWLVVLSDMEFDEGSANSKDDAMEKLRRYNPNLKIVWWNLSSMDTTTPETDEYGNVFMGGYNANLLKLLKAGFDADMFLKTLVENYKKNIENK